MLHCFGGFDETTRRHFLSVLWKADAANYTITITDIAGATQHSTATDLHVR